MNEVIEQLISKEELEKRVIEIANNINEDYKGKSIFMVCILKGGIVFMVDVARHIDVPVKFNFMDVSSYGLETKSTGNIQILMDLNKPIKGEHVLVIEDIVDSGNTLSYIKRLLLDREPASLKICSLLDKPTRREVDVTADYVGFEIPDEFVVGYGLDYDQRYRNLDSINILKFIND